LFDMIFSGAVAGVCALTAILIGIWQYKSKTPAGFYTFEKPLTEDDVSDVKMWNRKHGVMFMLYGAVILISWAAMPLSGGSEWGYAVSFSGILLPVPFMLLYHRKLVKQYRN